MLITGNTYPVREEIKALGGKWNAGSKGWDVPEENAAKAKALVAAQPPKEPRTAGSRACAECGRGGALVQDMEDGLMKHYGCCDMPPGGGW